VLSSTTLTYDVMKGNLMGTTTITLSTIASFFIVVLFLYLLYLIGGIAENLKKLTHKNG
jgi:hypothetical protein